MKVLVIGDLHFKQDNAEESEILIENIIKIVKKIQPNQIVILGDILHNHGTIYLYPLKRAVEFLKCLCELTETYLIIGNHDRPNPKVFLTDEHPFNALKKWEKIKVVDRTMIEYPFVYVPYVETGRFMEAIKDVDITKVKAFFAHQEFRGSIRSDRGDIWPPNYPPVISGHIHKHVVYKNVFYTGTPLQHSFFEPSENYVFLFNFSENVNEINYSKFDTCTPKKILIKTSANDAKNDIKKLLKNINSADKYLIIVEDDGSFDEIKLLKKIEKFRKQIRVIISRNYRSEVENMKNQRSFKSFIERLREKIEGDENCKKWFEIIFG